MRRGRIRPGAGQKCIFPLFRIVILIVLLLSFSKPPGIGALLMEENRNIIKQPLKSQFPQCHGYTQPANLEPSPAQRASSAWCSAYGISQCVWRAKGFRKSVFLDHAAPKFTPTPSASQSWSDPGPLHPGALGGALHTHLLCTDLHQGQLSLGCACTEPLFSGSSLTPFVATHHLCSLPLSLWADSLPGLCHAQDNPFGFSAVGAQH